MEINLNNKKFIAEFNSKNGEVTHQTVFSYNQKKNIIWAEYNGGEILEGSLLGKIVEDHFEFVYIHLNQENEFMSGKCKSYPEITKEGKIKLRESWQWTCKDKSSGHSVLIEI